MGRLALPSGLRRRPVDPVELERVKRVEALLGEEASAVVGRGVIRVAIGEEDRRGTAAGQVPMVAAERLAAIYGLCGR